MVLEPADNKGTVAASLFVMGGGFKKSCHLVDRQGGLAGSMILVPSQ